MTIGQTLTSQFGLSAGLVAVAGAWIIREAKLRIPKIIDDEEKKLIADVLLQLKFPEDVTLFKAILIWMDAKIPGDQHDVKYDACAAYIVSQCPALAPYKEYLSALLLACAQAAKQGLESSPK